MTGLLILLIIILLVFLVGIHRRTGDIQRELNSLNRRFRSVADELEKLSRSEKTITPSKAPDLPKPVEYQRPPEPVRYSAPEKTEEKQYTGSQHLPVPEKKPEPATQPFTIKKQTKSRDIEKFIGENLANKIGIAVLVLGISFFVKYAIDKNWINETGRVLIGFLCGSILIGIAHYIRKNYRSFSSVLIGGGLSVFYFSVAFAFHEYHLISQQFSFIAMVIITGFAVGLAVIYDRQELAILAIIGGFMTPFLVSTGKENYVALFTYLCILNTGMMALSWFKRWPAINILSLFFTTFIYGGWLIRAFFIMDDTQFPYRVAFIFATIFYLLFMAMNLLNNIRMNRKFVAFDIIIVFSIHVLYFSAGITILDYLKDGAYQGLFTVLIGIFNLLLAGIFHRKKKIDGNFVSLLLGLALGFISLAAPVQLRGDHVVMFWAVESVVLFWLYQRTRINHLNISSRILLLLMILCLVYSWTEIYLWDNNILPIIANKGFITGVIASIALLIYHWRLKKDPLIDSGSKGLTATDLKQMTLIAGLIVFYIVGVLEIWYQFSTRYPGSSLFSIYVQLFSFAFASFLLLLLKNSTSGLLQRIVLTLLCLSLYTFNISTNFDVSQYLRQSGSFIMIWGHWMGILLLGWLLLELLRHFYPVRSGNWSVYRTGITWIGVLGLAILLSAEMYQLMYWITINNPENWAWWQNLYYKAGLSILWGLCSFILMWIGMQGRDRTYRIMSLTLFTITLVKLFFYDIRKIPPGGKIAAFILLGVLLLTVSFMYQRLKKMIIDNPADTNHDHL